ncbi:Cell division protein FtsW [Clostridiaceae bacterium JG1575]|nr:Cell division protein FtsW [Clostridiaceae bacterium JG1575]
MQKMPLLTPTENISPAKALRWVLFLSAGCALALFLPALWQDGGRFALISDFNHQQIPFSMHSNWALRHGATNWDWYTDLGVPFLGAFGFYTLGSPFFWISFLFPPEAFPYLVGWLYMLKYVLAALMAFLWLKRYAKNPLWAVAGALLYAFAGFNSLNLMYYHFHEVMALFPLALYALDELLLEGRRGVFAFSIALCALVNYFFFFGEALFLLVYFLLRYPQKGWRGFWKNLKKAAPEALLGVLCAAVLLLPSALFIFNSPKAGQTLAADHFLLYPKERILLILKAFFFPPEAMIHQTIGEGFDFSSASLYLPCVGLGLLPAALKKPTVFRKPLGVLLLFMAIPVLNASFTLGNAFYYARWFYMPLLLMIVLTMQTLEEAPRRLCLQSLALVGSLTLLFSLLLSYGPLRPFLIHPESLSALTWTSLSGFIGTAVCLFLPPRRRAPAFLCLVVLFSVFTGQTSLRLYRGFHAEEQAAYARGYFQNLRHLPLVPPGDHEENYRFYTFDPGWNLSMIRHVPSVNSFTSTNSPATDEFFRAVGIEKIAASLFPEEPRDLLTLLSVRYLVETDLKPGYSLVTKRTSGIGDLWILENPAFIPLGFPLTHYLTKEALLDIPLPQRPAFLMDALVLPKGEKAPTHLSPMKSSLPPDPLSLAQEKRTQSVQNFWRTTDGFGGRANAPKATTYFFSVPWDRGWTAQVDGEPVPIRKTLGMMALDVPKGEHSVAFSYRTPGRLAGALISLFSTILLLYYTRRSRRGFKRTSHKNPKPPAR